MAYVFVLGRKRTTTNKRIYIYIYTHCILFTLYAYIYIYNIIHILHKFRGYINRLSTVYNRLTLPGAFSGHRGPRGFRRSGHRGPARRGGSSRGAGESEGADESGSMHIDTINWYWLVVTGYHNPMRWIMDSPMLTPGILTAGILTSSTIINHHQPSWLVVTGCHEFAIFPWILACFHHPQVMKPYFSEGFFPKHQEMFWCVVMSYVLVWFDMYITYMIFISWNSSSLYKSKIAEGWRVHHP